MQVVDVRLTKLEKKYQEAAKSLKTIKEKFDNYHVTSQTALTDFTNGVKSIEERITQFAGVKSIQDIVLADTTTSTTAKSVHISSELYISFESIYYFYTQYAALCNLYASDKPNELISSEIAKSRKLIDIGFSVLNKLREEGRAHEMNWSKNHGGLVEGTAEIEQSRNFAFDTPPEFIIDYKERLLALIDLLISQYELVENLRKKSPKFFSKAYKNFDADDVLIKLLSDVENSLNDDAHQFILKLVLNLNIDSFYKEALERCKDPNRKNSSFLLERTQTYFEYECMLKKEITSITNTYFTDENSTKSIAALEEKILEKQQKYKENISIFSKKTEDCADLYKKHLSSSKSESVQTKLLFLNISLGIYRKCSQKYTIAYEICSKILATPKDVIEFDILMKTMKQKDYAIKMMKVLIDALQELATQEDSKPFTMPTELGNMNMAWQGFGILALSVIQPLDEALKKLDNQSIDLGISLQLPPLLNTPSSSRRSTILIETRKLDASKKTRLQPESICTNNLLTPSSESASSNSSKVISTPASAHLSILRESIINDAEEKSEASASSSINKDMPPSPSISERKFFAWE